MNFCFVMGTRRDETRLSQVSSRPAEVLVSSRLALLVDKVQEETRLDRVSSRLVEVTVSSRLA